MCIYGYIGGFSGKFQKKKFFFKLVGKSRGKEGRESENKQVKCE